MHDTLPYLTLPCLTFRRVIFHYLALHYSMLRSIALQHYMTYIMIDSLFAHERTHSFTMCFKFTGCLLAHI